MSSVLYRGTNTNPMDQTPIPPPPTSAPSRPGDSAPAPWPTGAKVIVAILIAATLLGLIGSAIGLASGGDGASERRLRDRVASLTAERDDAVAQLADLDVQLTSLQQRLQATQDDLDAQGDRNGALADRISSLEGQVVTLTDERAAALDRAVALESSIGDLTGERDAALDSVDLLEASLATVQTRLAAVTVERDALAKLFPVTFDRPLADVVTPGKYGVKATETYCAGLASCGKAPAFADLTISKTADGYLRLAAPQLADGGLFRAGGALHLATGSTTVVPACNGVARTATVAMTIFPGSYTVDAKGAAALAGLSAVVTVEAPATGTCPAVLAFYSMTIGPPA